MIMQHHFIHFSHYDGILVIPSTSFSVINYFLFVCLSVSLWWPRSSRRAQSLAITQRVQDEARPSLSLLPFFLYTLFLLFASYPVRFMIISFPLFFPWLSFAFRLATYIQPYTNYSFYTFLSSFFFSLPHFLYDPCLRLSSHLRFFLPSFHLFAV